MDNGNGIQDQGLDVYPDDLPDTDIHGKSPCKMVVVEQVQALEELALRFFDQSVNDEGRENTEALRSPSFLLPQQGRDPPNDSEDQQAVTDPGKGIR